MSSFSMILATHGELAKGLVSTVEMIMGPQDNIYPISLLPGKGMKEIRSEMEEKIEQLKDQDCIFIVTDLFGGTPCNSSVLVGSDKENIRLLTGVNLPMLIQFCSSAAASPDQLSEELVEIGKEGIQFIHSTLDSKMEADSLD